MIFRALIEVALVTTKSIVLRDFGDMVKLFILFSLFFYYRIRWENVEILTSESHEYRLRVVESFSKN